MSKDVAAEIALLERMGFEPSVWLALTDKFIKLYQYLMRHKYLACTALSAGLRRSKERYCRWATGLNLRAPPGPGSSGARGGGSARNRARGMEAEPCSIMTITPGLDLIVRNRMAGRPLRERGRRCRHASRQFFEGCQI